MEIATLVSVLDHPHQAAEPIARLGPARRASRPADAARTGRCGLTLDLLAGAVRAARPALAETVRSQTHVLDALRRYLFAVRSPLALAALFERDPTALPMLLRGLVAGRRAGAELLIADPEAFDLLRHDRGAAAAARDDRQ